MTLNYYIDTEFLEGSQSKRFFGIEVGKTKPTIDLISIGIVCEDGREYYAVSKDFNLWEAWNRFQWKYQEDNPTILPETRKEKEYWIRENVLKPLFFDLWDKNQNLSNFHRIGRIFTYENMKRLLRLYGKSSSEIKTDLIQFILDPEEQALEKWLDGADSYFKAVSDYSVITPVFYAYFADYDWVVFCWIFGRMLDLPGKFPMYCKDLKQILDDVQEVRYGLTRDNQGNLYNDIKKLPNYPVQNNEHHALYDARWDRELHKFLNKI